MSEKRPLPSLQRLSCIYRFDVIWCINFYKVFPNAGLLNKKTSNRFCHHFASVSRSLSFEFSVPSEPPRNSIFSFDPFGV